MENYNNIFFQIVEGKERISAPAWGLAEAVTGCHNLTLICGGEAVFRYNGQEYAVKEGDLVYYEMGTLRSIHNNADKPVRFFAIDFYYVMPSYVSAWKGEEYPLPFKTVEALKDNYLYMRLKNFFNRFVSEWLTHTEYRHILCQKILLDIFQLLLMWKFQTDFSYDRLRKTEKAIYYMQEHYREKITLEELGRQVKVSGSYLCHIFKKELGKSPFQYLLIIRIGKACELLTAGMSVTDTAYRSGFQDVFYFSRCFKQLMGVSPSQYGKDHNEQGETMSAESKKKLSETVYK